VGQVPAGLAPLMRFLQGIKPWGMVEVFMLGILVALVKLTEEYSGDRRNILGTVCKTNGFQFRRIFTQHEAQLNILV